MLTRRRALRYAPCVHTAAEGAQDNMHDAGFHVHAFPDASPRALHTFANICARALGCKLLAHRRSLGPERSRTRMHGL